LHKTFGSSGDQLWELAHGRDDRPVVPERDAKSISNETTFHQDISDRDVLRAWLAGLAEQVGWRMRRHHLRARTVHLKIRFADFSTITRAQTLPEPTDITQDLWRAADDLLCHRLPAGHMPVRLVGMGVSGLDDSGLVQGMLFDGEEREKQCRVDAVTDQVKEKFGKNSLRRGSTLGHGNRENEA
jgi:DNA polymerase-4